MPAVTEITPQLTRRRHIHNSQQDTHRQIHTQTNTHRDKYTQIGRGRRVGREEDRGKECVSNTERK